MGECFGGEGGGGREVWCVKWMVVVVVVVVVDESTGKDMIPVFYLSGFN